MAKYIELVNGRLSEKAGSDASAGVADAGSIVQLNSAGQIDPTMLPTEALSEDAVSATAAEALASGDFVYIASDGVRKADAGSAGKEAMGFVKDAVAAAQTGTVYFEGRNQNLTGIVAGTRYYLDPTTAGAITTTPPSTAGQVSQYVGRGVDATSISFEPDVGTVIA